MDNAYQNIHTNEVLKLVKVETIRNNPNPITVYVLEDGSRWDEKQFKEHWHVIIDTHQVK